MSVYALCLTLKTPMPAKANRTVALRGTTPIYKFRAYGLEQAKRLGLIDSSRSRGRYAPVSDSYSHGSAHLLEAELQRMPDAILVAHKRNEIVIYRPKRRIK